MDAGENNTRVSAKVQFGFWVYLMTDLVLFATLFATYAVMQNSTFGGPSGKELFDMPFVLAETLILLTSSFTCGLGIIALRRQHNTGVLVWFAVTFLLGVAFLSLELTEFSQLIHEGNGWQRSGFLSAFFTLVGTHGLHIFVGLLWMSVLLVSVARQGLLEQTSNRLLLLGMFWHFLDVVWIFIYTIVYLMGVG